MGKEISSVTVPGFTSREGDPQHKCGPRAPWKCISIETLAFLFLCVCLCQGLLRAVTSSLVSKTCIASCTSGRQQLSFLDLGVWAASGKSRAGS